MSGSLHFDAELLSDMLAASGGQVPASAPLPTEISQLAQNIDKFVYAAFRRNPTPENIKRTSFDVESFDGASIKVHRFAVDNDLTNLPRPAVLYVHGGGMIASSVDTYDPVISRHASHTGIPFFAVEYRLAPELTGDGLVRDAYAALEFLHARAAELGINTSRIAIMGDSAGGGIAAGTALMARDKGIQPPLAKQVLMYPMLDDRTPAPAPDSPLGKFLFVWDGGKSEMAWGALLGKDKAGVEDADVSIYAAPGRATDLSNLPETYVEVGGLDMFASEAIAYVGKLVQANVQAEFHLLPGLVHGYDSAPTSLSKMGIQARYRFLKDL